MHKYGVALEQLSPQGQASTQAAERQGARTVIYREQVPVACIVPIDDLRTLETGDHIETGEDPLLLLCGTCKGDAFVDGLAGELTRTVLFRR